MEAARRLLESEGEQALTMRRLAAEVGIRAPSLYKHFADREAILVALMALGLAEFADAIEPNASDLSALAAAYRTYAKQHPHLYELLTNRPLPREQLPSGLEARAAEPLIRVAGSVERARAVWGMAHGLVMLELRGRFPAAADVDAAWRTGVQALAPR